LVFAFKLILKKRDLDVPKKGAVTLPGRGAGGSRVTIKYPLHCYTVRPLEFSVDGAIQCSATGTYISRVCERCHLQFSNIGSKSSALFFKELFSVRTPEKIENYKLYFRIAVK
jgi:hypothetical protein